MHRYFFLLLFSPVLAGAGRFCSGNKYELGNMQGCLSFPSQLNVFTVSVKGDLYLSFPKILITIDFDFKQLIWTSVAFYSWHSGLESDVGEMYCDSKGAGRTFGLHQ